MDNNTPIATPINQAIPIDSYTVTNNIHDANIVESQGEILQNRDIILEGAMIFNRFRTQAIIAANRDYNNQLNAYNKCVYSFILIFLLIIIISIILDV